ncbi:helix-turn-helix domain-containing protein [Streptomyces sp. NPDC058221]|uniref:helix-turn-helix domain-containing protein n=1 Tax=Streptomyces sp. NPDC058221 TaxID=3346388 RepID=UPI0036EEAD46
MAEEEQHTIEIHLTRLLNERGMTLTELAAQVGITIANLSVLKNGRAKAIRFSTLSRICDVLHCQPGDLMTHASAPAPGGAEAGTDGERDRPRRGR